MHFTYRICTVFFVKFSFFTRHRVFPLNIISVCVIIVFIFLIILNFVTSEQGCIAQTQEYSMKTVVRQIEEELFNTASRTYAHSSYGKLKSTEWERLPKIHIYFHNTMLRDLSLCEDCLYCRVSFSSSSDFTTDESFLPVSELHMYTHRDTFHLLNV